MYSPYLSMEGSANMFGSLKNIISRRRVAFALFTVVILTVIFHAGTFLGLDSDFQGHALRSRLVFLGQSPYVDIFDHKPPLYYFILLPGNLLGGHLLSFFVIHLLYLAFLSILIFHYGKKIAYGNNIGAGFIVVFLFLYLTAVQFFLYGNLNGGIVYPVIIFNLLVFFKTHEFLLNENSEFNARLKQIGIIGLMSGCSFLIRFSSTAALLVASAFLFLLLFKQVSLSKIIKLGIVYSLAFIIPAILFLLFYQPPLSVLYDQLIKYNEFYSHLSASSLVPKAVETTIIGFRKYAVLPIFICLLSLCVYFTKFVVTVFFKTKQNIKAGSRTSERSSNHLLIYFLLLYLVFELLSVFLQKTGMKEYPFFPTFIPIIFLGLISISYLSSLFRYPKRIFLAFSIIISLFVLFEFIGTINSNKGFIIARAKWPEKKLIKKIKSLAQKPDDLFTIDYCPYIYLETKTIPPIERFSFYEPKWSIYNTKPHLKEELLSKLIDKPPRLLLTYSPNLTNSEESIIKYPSEFKDLMQFYDEEGEYRITYAKRKVQLYLRKDIVELK